MQDLRRNTGCDCKKLDAIAFHKTQQNTAVTLKQKLQKSKYCTAGATGSPCSFTQTLQLSKIFAHGILDQVLPLYARNMVWMGVGGRATKSQLSCCYWCNCACPVCNARIVITTLKIKTATYSKVS